MEGFVRLVAIAFAANGRHQPLTLAATILEEERELAATIDKYINLCAAAIVEEEEPPSLPINRYQKREQSVRDCECNREEERKRSCCNG